MSGGAVICAGACVYWLSRMLKYVALLTSKAEYVALEQGIFKIEAGAFHEFQPTHEIVRPKRPII